MYLCIVIRSFTHLNSTTMTTMTASHIVSSSILDSVLKNESNVKGASFTLRSIATGKDYTYKISRSEFKGKWYTHIKVETQYLEFVRLGTYFGGKIRNKGQVVESPSAQAIAFVLSHVEKGNFDGLDAKLEVMHLGKCLMCGKTLTDAISIERGLGPTCASK